jgi:hypothetical protein
VAVAVLAVTEVEDGVGVRLGVSVMVGVLVATEPDVGVAERKGVGDRVKVGVKVGPGVGVAAPAFLQLIVPESSTVPEVFI